MTSRPTVSPSIARAGRPTWLKLLAFGLLLAVVVAVAGGLWYLFLRPAPPAAVGLSTASPTTSAAPQTAAPSAGGSAAASSDPGTATGLDGTWSVDPSVGSFSDFSGSFVGYRIDEELANIGAQTAVGRTPDVTGSLTLAGTQLTAVEISADVSTLESDNRNRDNQLRRQALESSTYPTVTFTLSEPIDLGSAPVDGQTISVTATGDLTIHGQTRSVQIPIQARLSGNVVTAVGSLDILLADYGMERPQSFMVLSISDTATIEFQLQFTNA